MRVFSTFCFLFIAINCFGQPVDTSSVAKAVAGKITGVNILPVKKDTAKTTFRFHCMASHTTYDEPLIVIDGIPQIISVLNKLDPNSIDSITIVKGSIAMALYGSRGANGAILISTKKLKKITTVIKKDSLTAIRGIKVYPNPAPRGSIITIQPGDSTGKNNEARIISIDGKTVLQQALNTNEETKGFQVQTGSGWLPGVYFVQLLYANGRVFASEKVIIQ